MYCFPQFCGLTGQFFIPPPPTPWYPLGSLIQLPLFGKLWLKLPTLARYGNYLHELSHKRRSWYGTWCCPKNERGEFGRGQQEGGEDQPPRTLGAGIHHGWEMWVKSHGKDPEPYQIWAKHDDWPEITQKLTWRSEPSGRAVLLGSPTLQLSGRSPTFSKSFALSACVSMDNFFFPFFFFFFFFVFLGLLPQHMEVPSLGV